MFAGLRAAFGGPSPKDEEDKALLLEAVTNTVKQFLKSNSDAAEVTRHNTEALEICSALEDILLHGLKQQGQDTQFVMLWEFLGNITHGETLQTLDDLPLETTSNKCRAWIRVALNEGLFANYMETVKMGNDMCSVNNYYLAGAFIRDTGFEKLEILCGVLKSLETFNFNLSIGELCAKPTSSSTATTATTTATTTTPKVDDWSDVAVCVAPAVVENIPKSTTPKRSRADKKIKKSKTRPRSISQNEDVRVRSASQNDDYNNDDSESGSIISDRNQRTIPVESVFELKPQTRKQSSFLNIAGQSVSLSVETKFDETEIVLKRAATLTCLSLDLREAEHLRDLLNQYFAPALQHQHPGFEATNIELSPPLLPPSSSSVQSLFEKVSPHDEPHDAASDGTHVQVDAMVVVVATNVDDREENDVVGSEVAMMDNLQTTTITAVTTPATTTATTTPTTATLTTVMKPTTTTVIDNQSINYATVVGNDTTTPLPTPTTTTTTTTPPTSSTLSTSSSSSTSISTPSLMLGGALPKEVVDPMMRPPSATPTPTPTPSATPLEGGIIDPMAPTPTPDTSTMDWMILEATRVRQQQQQQQMLLIQAQQKSTIKSNKKSKKKPLDNDQDPVLTEKEVKAKAKAAEWRSMKAALDQKLKADRDAETKEEEEDHVEQAVDTTPSDRSTSDVPNTTTTTTTNTTTDTDTATTNNANNSNNDDDDSNANTNTNTDNDSNTNTNNDSNTNNDNNIDDSTSTTTTNSNTITNTNTNTNTTDTDAYNNNPTTPHASGNIITPVAVAHANTTDVTITAVAVVGSKDNNDDNNNNGDNNNNNDNNNNDDNNSNDDDDNIDDDSNNGDNDGKENGDNGGVGGTAVDDDDSDEEETF